jgi:tRNA(His) 5'-end guanylyltransferase
MLQSLRERIKSYAEISDQKLLPKLPIIISINGRQFRKITSLLEKPFDVRFFELMASSAIKLMNEVDGSTFAFVFNDEITLISRNDQTLDTEPYYDGKTQKIASATAAIATLEFNALAKEKNIEFFGDPIFTSQAFVVPHIGEAINLLVSKQQQAFYTAVYQMCFHLMTKQYDADRVRDILNNKTIEEKIDILKEDFGRNINDEPPAVRSGVGIYRGNKVFVIDGVEKMKRKIIINTELPDFAKEIGFLGKILGEKNA